MAFAARFALALSVVAASCVSPAIAARKAVHKPAPPAARNAAPAEQPTLLGVSKDWTAYQANSPEGKVCYALSKPTDVLPKKSVRDPIYVIISVWPGRNVKDELQIVPGYLYKEGEPVYAQVGANKTEFFTRNDSKAGSAWIKDVSDEDALVRAMRGGSTLTVTGTSKKGVRTTDTYSLSGIGTALTRAHEACGK
jgi:hypothetical protein